MQQRYFALVDCNNFYASCERVFQPRLEGKPIVVLSNNDGCVIARSNEAKEMGIPMGEPFFKINRLAKAGGVQVFSSNFTLYGDLSRRVMEVLAQHCADIEIYSIDEAFLELRFAQQTPESLLGWAGDLKEKVQRWTGIPVSIGIAPTKTLAKMANHIAKKRTVSGVYFLLPGDNVLQKTGVDKVWGCGRAYTQRLSTVNVTTVRELQIVDEAWMRKEFGVVGLRLLLELNGKVCQELEPPQQSRKNTMVSRSFANDLYELAEIKRRLALYATRLGEKLRQYNQAATVLTVYLWVNRFKNKRTDGRSCFLKTLTLPLATNHTNELIKWSGILTEHLFEAGTNYKKAGIMAGELVPQQLVQGNLFQPQESHQRNANVTEAMDAINRKVGKNTLYFASCGERPSIPMRQHFRSPNYSTCWQDLLLVKR